MSATSGLVLGGVSCAAIRPCASRLVATVNGGASWRFVETPKVSLGKAVSSVQVANGLDGWLYGPGLWSTHDGGARWRKLSLPGAVVQMADSAGTVYAVWSRIRRRTAPGSCSAARWAGTHGPAPATSQATPTPQGTVWRCSAGRSGLATARIYGRLPTGAHWRRSAFHCTGTNFGLWYIAAASTSDVVFLCVGPGNEGSSGIRVLISADGGTTVHLTGKSAVGGAPYGFAVPDGRANVVTPCLLRQPGRSRSVGQ